jgi:hypothetical protein
VSTPSELEFDYEITLVEDERARQLAAAQAASILEVLHWLGRTPESSTASKPTPDS